MESERSAIAGVLAAAALAGGLLGAGSIVLPRLAVGGGRAAVATLGAQRVRQPQVGDEWGGCNDARAAGTAPIYRGEPGYRTDMDGDNDGVACEPHRED